MSETFVPFGLDGVLLGVATAATQIEGGSTGSTWSVWAAQPGRIKDGSTCDRATDHWVRWREDTELMASLGIQIYRMGIEWSRIEPEPGEWDEPALARYRAELNLLRTKGIRPMITLHHFSEPQWFADAGGWLGDGALEAWERYVRMVLRAFGDLVDDWVTINEPNVYVTGGWVFGNFPPGRRSLGEAMRVYGVLVAAHVIAYELIHDVLPRDGVMVGVAHHLRPFEPGSRWNPWHRVLTPGMRHLFQGAITEAMTTGRVRLPLRLPRGFRVSPGRYADFFGLNYYSRTTVTRFDDGTPAGVPVNDLGWEVYAAGLAQMATWAWERHQLPVWVTENGTCDNTDAFRARYLEEHLRAVADVRGRGLPLDRYYHWCFVDNWEWDDGEVPRFGLVALDYETQERRVKDSGRFFAEVVGAGGVTAELHAKHVAGQEYPVSGSDRHGT